MERRHVKTKLIKNKKKREKRNLTKEQALEIMQEQVFTDHNYRRHIDQTADELGYPVEVVETVVTDYLKRISIDILRVTKQIRRYIFIGWAHLDILEEMNYEHNDIKSERYQKTKKNGKF